MHLNTFGFFKDGFMKVNVSNLSLKPPMSAAKGTEVSHFESNHCLKLSVKLPLHWMFELV